MTQKQTKFWTPGARCAFRLIAGVAALSATALTAQVTQRPNYPTFGAPQQQLQLLPVPVTQPITANGTVVEDVVARVNDQIITRSEYEQALKGLKEDALRQGATQEQLDAEQKNLLRDMIDQQILLARGKELGITGDAEMTRRLDDIRKQNHLDSMEALEKAAATQGVSFEDFKQNIRNQAIQQKVVNQEVGSHLNITHAEEEAYYKAHASEFTVPEQIHLSEILIPTAEKATDAELAAAKAKAEAAEQKLKEGTGFSELAKTVSSGPTAAAGGDLGDFQRGQLGDVLE
ncbi:MAG: peptidylprolyl isomerase, partial [Bryocella sp.]